MSILKSTLQLSLVDGITRKMGGITGSLDRLESKTRALSSPLLGMAGRLVALGGAYVGVTEGAERTFGAASKLQDQISEIGIKAGLSGAQLDAMQSRLKSISPTVNQLTGDLATGVDTMVGMGLAASDAEAAIPAIGKAATATGASITDLSASAVSAMQNLGVLPSELTKILDGMTAAGNAGAFELKDMATYFPSLGAGYQALGQKGVGAVNDLAAALQVVRTGTGDSATAANDLKNLLQKIQAPQTVKSFKGMGVNLEKELKKGAARGLSPIEAIAEITNKTLKGDMGKIGDLFADAQVQEALRPLIQNMALYRQIRDEANKAVGTVDDSYARRMGNANEKVRALNIRIDNLGTSIGANLLGPVGDAAASITHVLDTLGSRVTIVDRIFTPIQGFLKGLGAEGDIGKNLKGISDFLFGVEDGGKAADTLGRIFLQFRGYGEDVRYLTDAINQSPLGTFLQNIGGAGLDLLLTAGGIALVAGSISTLAGALLKLSGASAAFGLLKALTGGGAVPGLPTVPGGKNAPKNGSGKGFGLGSLLGAWNMYDLVSRIPDNPDDLQKFCDENKKSAADTNSWLDGKITTPSEWFKSQMAPGKYAADAANAPAGQNAFAGVENRLAGSPVTVEALAAALRPSGPQPVTVTNPQAPNVTVSNVFNIAGATDPLAVGRAAAASVGQQVKDAVEASTGGGGGF